MRPDQDMHAAVEEVELEPCDFFTDVGTLIIEGRVPGFSDKGFGEGPHCPPIHGQNRHICDAVSPNCQQQEQLEKHMLLLWKNGIPMSVEVLLYPDCCRPHGRFVQVETSAAPEITSCTLLEQWTLHMLQKRVPDANITPRSLMQAVRSFLHFSQLSAWLSLGKGKLNTNVRYRVCVPGEAFSSKFEQNPDLHTFPISNVGRSHAMKIMVKSLPRQGEVPKVPCTKHDPNHMEAGPALREGIGSVKGHCRFPYHQNSLMSPMGHVEPIRGCVAEKFKRGNKEQVSSRLQEFKVSLGTREPSLGDSLLDPPQSLHMYPKRYQSPSRCGSPSVEMPEHLMFGLGATAAHRELDIGSVHHKPSSSHAKVRDRSRPQRQPVIERFLKKEYGVNTTSNTSHPCDRFMHLDNVTKQPPLDKTEMMIPEVVKKTVSLYPGEFPSPQLPQEEMHLVLDRLRHRFQPSKLALTTEEHYLRGKRDSEDNYLFKTFMHKELIPNEQHRLEERKRKSAEKNLAQFKLQSPLQQTNAKNTLSHKLEESKHSFESTSGLLQSSSPLASFALTPSAFPNHSVSPVLQEPQTVPISKQQYQNKTTQLDANLVKEEKCEENLNSLMEILERDEQLDVTENICDQSSNFIEANRTLDQTTDDSNSSNADESIDSINCDFLSAILARGKGRNLSLLYNILRSNINLPMQAESPDRNGHLIPSAAEKLKFRRSLDSATSMVFHQNTGLPLTSSPAPIRKSGTCFDFDSSLTSVSAIKKALFEKDWQETTKHLLSTSTPSSTTTNNLLGNFEESVLNGRLEPVSTVEGFTAEIGASGSFCPRHKTLPVTVFFYTLHDTHKVTSPYLGHINLGRKGYNIPKIGTVQVTLFNPHGTVVKMFVVCYDLSDMPSNSQTFLRQRTLYMPTNASENDDEARKWLRYLIHLRFASSKSGKVYLHTDMRMIVFRKSDLDAATIHGQRPYELRSFTQGPENPKFSPCK